MEELKTTIVNLENTGQKINDLLILLDVLDSKIDSVNRDLNIVRQLASNVSSNVQVLRDRISETVNVVNSAPEPISSIRNSIGQLQLSFAVLDQSYRILQNHLNLDLGESEAIISVIRGPALAVRNNLNLVLEQWKDVKNLDYKSLVPLTFTYSSVTERDYYGQSIEEDFFQNIVSPDRKRFTFLDYLFPSFLMFFIIFVSLVFSAVTVFKDRSSKHISAI